MMMVKLCIQSQPNPIDNLAENCIYNMMHFSKTLITCIYIIYENVNIYYLNHHERVMNKNCVLPGDASECSHTKLEAAPINHFHAGPSYNTLFCCPGLQIYHARTEKNQFLLSCLLNAVKCAPEFLNLPMMFK